MKTYSQEELRDVIENHKMWVNCREDGHRANLRGVNLRGANLMDADLRRADLSGADLSCADLSDANLRGANLRGANLSNANLRGEDLRRADLRDANLRDADLRCVDLRGVDLRGADLRGADIDFSAWPLSCGSLSLQIDDRIKKQLLYHVISVIGSEMFTADQIDFANGFHRVGEIPRVERAKNEKL